MKSLSHRRAAVAGRFYPAPPLLLRAQVDACLAEAGPAPAADRPPKLLVVPHAGYVYSGPVAAQAYALLAPWRDRIRRVVLLGPTHRVAVRGLAAPAVQVFDTPLGGVPVDATALACLADLPQVVVSDAAHAQEHALEVQLPFLQTVLGDFTLVPLAVGRADAAEVAEVLERLWGGEETLVVISTDLSHYLPYDQATALDAQTVGRVLHFDSRIAHDQACGATPLNGALGVARAHGLRPQLLDLRNSGDTAGDRDRVVGYAALVFWPAAAPADFTDAERSTQDAGDLGAALIARARNAIAAELGLPQRPEPHHPALARPGATFVTLHHRGSLRGCIGRLEAADHPLHEDVRHNAQRAAFHDPRFEPLQAHEWDELHVEVSVIQPAQPLAVRSEAEACAALQPGADGVILEWRGRRATFLPQVWEQLPGPGEFLGALKRKAGLRADFWADDLTLARYRVLAFEEPPHHAVPGRHGPAS